MVIIIACLVGALLVHQVGIALDKLLERALRRREPFPNWFCGALIFVAVFGIILIGSLIAAPAGLYALQSVKMATGM